MIKVQGIVLHYFDKVANNDKFYRAFMLELPTGGYRVVYCWGRDGSAGQKKIETYTNEPYARRNLETKCQDKQRKGYQRLGEGEIFVEDSMLDELAYISDKLYAWHGKAPDKSRGTGYSYLIVEEETPEDLIKRLMK